ncbi:hypothetical protein AN644_03390 [Candidatus Epulonipiscium fishelsonii]|nr:hypothetical protein AN644_03390 [Epulopiscium sp. SCG-C06WGA-EpuloA1]
MIKLNAHMHGKYVNLNSVKDEAFSSGMLGKGVAIIPEFGVVFAPANATIATIFDTLHAITMVTEDGM